MYSIRDNILSHSLIYFRSYHTFSKKISDFHYVNIDMFRRRLISHTFG